MTTKTIWYEQRCFHLCTDADRTVVCDPLAGEGVEFVEAMAKHGWEDDPRCDNSSGFVYLRRPIDAHTENYDGSQFLGRLQRVERGDLEKLGKLDSRANAAVAVMEALEKGNAATHTKLETERKRITKLVELFNTAQKANGELDAQVAELVAQDTEVADPALLKALVAQVDQLQGMHTHLNEVYESFRQELAQVVDEQTGVGLKHMDGFKTALRSMKATVERQDKDHASLQRDYGSLTTQIKDLIRKLDEEEFQRKMLDTRVSGLDVVVAEKIAGAEGGVVAAMETAMPGTTWEVKIEGGKR